MAGFRIWPMWSMAHVEQLTFLLFLKMSHELTQAPYKNINRIPQSKDNTGKGRPRLAQ